MMEEIREDVIYLMLYAGVTVLNLIASGQRFTVSQLVQQSGYRNYTTFSTAFKQRMGMNVTAWMQSFK